MIFLLNRLFHPYLRLTKQSCKYGSGPVVHTFHENAINQIGKKNPHVRWSLIQCT